MVARILRCTHTSVIKGVKITKCVLALCPNCLKASMVRAFLGAHAETHWLAKMIYLRT